MTRLDSSELVMTAQEKRRAPDMKKERRVSREEPTTRPVPFSAAQLLVLLACLLIVVFTAYWKCLRLPFIQDDWRVQINFAQTGWHGFLQTATHLKGALFYRPLSLLYLYGMRQTFGLDPLAFHVAALLIHALNGLLIVLIFRRLLADRLLPFAAGLLYLLAAPLLIETLMWTVGINDLGAALFFFLGMLLYLQGRSLAGAAAYLAGCLFKESALPLPFILAAMAAAGFSAGSDRPGIAARLRTLLPFLPVLLVVSLVKALGVSPGGLPDTHPYAVRLFGLHVIKNGAAYLLWLGQAIFPLEIHALGAVGRVIVPGLLLAVLAFALLLALRRAGRRRLRLLAVLAVWAAVPLLLVLFLPNHRFRYYAIYSAPAFIAVFLLAVSSLLESMRLSERRAQVVLAALVVVSAGLSYRAASTILSEGLQQESFASGTNSLVERAATVDVVRAGLLSNLPDPPPGAALLLGSVDLWAFDKDLGPRLWYDRDDLHVYPLESARRDSLGLYIANPVEDQAQAFMGGASARFDLAGRPVYAFKLREGRLAPVELGSIPRDPAAGERSPSE